ncbi:sensor histidine kinase [Actinosynnema sp. NPDC020468]|uniref:sensor histidine kinase n=1 Tax=Actinosynnema sp. NPDC020468 TaxID=3154488 RepID=UPI0033E78D4F
MRFPPILVDVVLAVVFTGLTIGAVLSQGHADAAAVLLGSLTTAPIALRQRAPVVTAAVILLAVDTYALTHDGLPPNGGMGVLVAMVTVAMLRPRWVAAAVYGATSLSMALPLLYAPAPRYAPWDLVESALVLLGAWALGESTRRWGDRVERLAERAARARADERVRIARELHDVVAHHLSVVSLQAGVARYVLDSDLDTARRAITTVGDTSREALTELRRVLQVLRVEDQGELGPQPGLADLDRLVERTRLAGVPVDVVVRGEERPLPPGPDLCAYRVAQESLTNVLKHAGKAAVTMTIHHRDHRLTLEVANTGDAPSPPPRGGTAHGLRGMRERAELYGGTVRAGAVPGGFRVVLELPTGRVR